MSESEPVIAQPDVATSPDERLEADALRAELDDVERALARLDDGTYGTCEVCGSVLTDDQLAERPQTRLCEQHRG